VVRGIVKLEVFEVVARKISTCQDASKVAGREKNTNSTLK
jgi:hypothetical protein